MGQNIGGKATWDESQLQGITGGVSVGLRAPRTDLRPEEKCYVALNNDRITVRGFIKVYPDGSASYWFYERTQGKAAANLEDAQRKLFAITGVGNAALSPLTVEATGTVG